MTMKEQWKRIKDNWLIIAVVIALLLFMNIGGMSSVQNISRSMATDTIGSAKYAYESDGAYYEYTGSSGYSPSYTSDFAPDVEERKIIKTASMSTEVENGEYKSAEQRLKDMITASDSYLLSENVYKYGTDRKQYYSGSYQIKVDTAKYDALVSQLKTIGEVQSFNERTNDVTGQYTNTEINLEVEKARLERYNEMYAEATEINDKINLNDRIFDQERTIKYLEDSLDRIDQKIEYTSISFSMSEKRSSYADVAFVKLSDLVKDFVGSINALLVFIFTIIPWAIVVLIGIVVWRFMKRN